MRRVARQLRIQYPGAIYHVMARGDRREAIYLSDGDRVAFLKALGDMCERTGMVVWAYCLMDNHYHLMLETPQPNLVEGMKWLQNTYTRRFNNFHGLWGHLFGGRYKAIVVEALPMPMQRVGDYVHLNPVRAGLAKPETGLDRYEWSSLHALRLAPARRAPWLRLDRLLQASDCADTAQGRRAYLERLERRAHEQGTAQAGLVDPESAPGLSLQATLQRGWYFGSEEFRKRMLALLASAGRKARVAAADGYVGSQARDRCEGAAAEFLSLACASLGWSQEGLREQAANHAEKILIGEILMAKFSVRLDWVSEQLGMGSRSYCCRLLGKQRLSAADNPRVKRRRFALLKQCNIQ